MTVHVPRATYRLQLHRDFTFERARELVPYLHALGISDCYVSPCLKARPGSQHGYDIVDHSTLNPELGSESDYDNLVAALKAHGMGQVLDIVPNHMGVGGSDNPWWLDVMENGPASVYAEYFDIDWELAQRRFGGKVLIAVLEDAYGIVLEKGLLKLTFDEARGEFVLHYYDHRFPIDPQTYPAILQSLTKTLAPSSALSALQERLADFEKLPSHWETMPQRRVERQRQAEAAKVRLAMVCREIPPLRTAIDEALVALNGRSGEGSSFDVLHELIERQAYRLAHWRAAADEINYRRFFDINLLAALRMERREVFDATHWLVLELIAAGKVRGLRLDHPDGLYDPAQYYEQLQQAIAARTGAADLPALYTVTEKILAEHESLRAASQVHGTTGYDFAALVEGILIQPAGRERLTKVYERFIGQPANFDDIVYQNKKLIMRTVLSSELMVLANRLNTISEINRHTRDYTLHRLREALMEFVACLPVYRTYVTSAGMDEQDSRYIEWALRDARRRSQSAETSIFDFLREVLYLNAVDKKSALHAQCVDFVMKLQQYSAPVMAKGVEDTAFYVYHRLISLNEVGGDPRRFGTTLKSFHRANSGRRAQWPHALLSTSTHDSKRSEDVRARLHVLSEIGGEWGRRVKRWSSINKRLRGKASGPSSNDEYLLYQTLLGVWPLETIVPDQLDAFRERIEAYMLKAAREAKVDTSWINQNEEYEKALTKFVRAVLAPEKNSFLEDFLPFQKRIAHFGLLNSLSLTLIKLTAPGVPDIYQGNELWDFSLVDPDNRRPVDYDKRRALLENLKTLAPFRAPNALAQLLENITDGRAKLYLIWRTLWLRQHWPDVFAAGEYLPITAEGSRAENVCAYARRTDTSAVIAVAPRWPTRLIGDDSMSFPLGRDVWGDTVIEGVAGYERYVNVLTGESLEATMRGGRPLLSAAEVFGKFPVAVLVAGANLAVLDL